MVSCINISDQQIEKFVDSLLHNPGTTSEDILRAEEKLRAINSLRRVQKTTQEIQDRVLTKVAEMAMEGNLEAAKLLDKYSLRIPKKKSDADVHVNLHQQITETAKPDISKVVQQVTDLNRQSFEQIPAQEAQRLVEAGVTPAPVLPAA